MNTALFYDTETTGLPMYKDPSDHPDQPHIVQLAACVVDLDTRKIINSMDVTIFPDGWVIPAEVTAIHGITTDHALEVGVPEGVALAMFMSMWDGRLRIGHNESFDARILRIAQHRHGATDDVLAKWKEGQAECTCWMARPHTQLPKNKLPKLTEAYQHFMGKPMANAHTAMADVQACIDVYFAIRDAAIPVPQAA